MNRPHQAISNKQLLSNGHGIPNDINATSKVMLRFKEPVPKALAWEFFRIRLTPRMKGDGEDAFCQNVKYQPKSAEHPVCKLCTVKMRRVGHWEWKCWNENCVNKTTWINKPKTGVIKVTVPEDAIRHDAENDIDLIDKLILVLDRRYNEQTLAAVYRTACELAERLGAKTVRNNL